MRTDYSSVFSRLNPRRYRLVGYGFASILCLKAVPDSFLLNYFRKRAQYRGAKAQEVPLDDHVQTLTNEVILTLPYDTEYLSKIHVFYTKRIDPNHGGYIKSRFGSTVGIPYYARYRNLEEVQKGEFSKREYLPVDWQSEVGVRLANSLLLSDKAVKFLIAQGCNYVDSYDCRKTLAIFAGYFLIGFYAGLVLARLLDRLKNWAAFSVGFTYWLFITVCYLRILDQYNYTLDITVDKETAKMSREIAEGGIEYYEKTIQRNKILREIAPSKLRYTMYGNVKYVSLRPMPHAPLTTRKEMLQDFISKQW